MITKHDSKPSRPKEPSAADHQEVEWQFDAGELEPVEGWLGQQSSGSSGFVVAPEPTLEITDSYYDTDDWRFYRASYAPRVYSERCAREAKDLRSAVPDSNPFRVLTKGKEWKILEDRRESVVQGESVR